MRPLNWIILGLIFSTFCFADSLTVYRWVDKNNVVHFSQHQPAHDNYTEMSLANSNIPINDTVNAPDEIETEVPIDISSTPDKCEEARANISTLKTFERIQFTDASGKVQVLDDKAKELQLQINEKQLELYCP